MTKEQLEEILSKVWMRDWSADDASDAIWGETFSDTKQPAPTPPLTHQPKMKTESQIEELNLRIEKAHTAYAAATEAATAAYAAAVAAATAAHTAFAAAIAARAAYNDTAAEANTTTNHH